MTPGRRLHPGAWWVWALGLATAASRTTNPHLQLLVIGVVSLVVAVRRSEAAWGRGFRYYLWAGLFVIVIRVGFRVVFAGVVSGTVLFTLPEVALPGWMTGISLGGPVTVESLLGGLYDGLRLAAMLICVGGANALADAKRLLRSVPRALHDLGAAVVVAVGFAPQLVESTMRVRRAQRLRGHAGGGARVVRRTLMPVLEGATGRALVLAGSMEARGYGRVDPESGGAVVVARLVLAGLAGVAIGLYGLLDGSVPGALGAPVLVIGLGLAAAGFIVAGRGVAATVYRPDTWEWVEWTISLCGVVAAAGVVATGWADPAGTFPPPTGWPPLPAPAAMAVLVGAIPATPLLGPWPARRLQEGDR